MKLSLKSQGINIKENCYLHCPRVLRERKKKGCVNKYKEVKMKMNPYVIGITFSVLLIVVLLTNINVDAQTRAWAQSTCTAKGILGNTIWTVTLYEEWYIDNDQIVAYMNPPILQVNIYWYGWNSADRYSSATLYSPKIGYAYGYVKMIYAPLGIIAEVIDVNLWIWFYNDGTSQGGNNCMW
jgi:hypothetical protein